MPVISFNYRDLINILGKEIPVEELIEIIPMMGADFHHYDKSIEELNIEFFPDRPDNYSVEGVARSLRSFLGLQKGLKKYPCEESEIVLKVERNVENVRPYVVGGVVKDVIMNDNLIRSLMELQEKIHLTVGRKRQKVAIGVHDLDKVTPPFIYKAIEPESISFVPLGKEEKMNLRQILHNHEKGVEYSFILEGKTRYPIIVDSNNEVLSFPPIINGRLTTVTEKTKNIFIDVTGMDFATISGVLNIVATALAERGGKIQTITVQSRRKLFTPHLEPDRWKINPSYVNRWLGLNLSVEEMISCLEIMGLSAFMDRGKLHVLVPPTRMDILHNVDIIEDIAKGYGYGRFGSKLPEIHTIGYEKEIERASDIIRQMMIGYGYYEVTTLTLSNRREQFELMMLPPSECVEILNPITKDHDCLRVSLIPSLLAVLRKGKHRDLPQRIFEVGDVVINSKRQRNLALATIHSKASFTELKSIAQGMMQDFSVEFSIQPCDLPFYLPGRAAYIIVGGVTIGHFGELHPSVITSYELSHPITTLEITLDKIIHGRGFKLI